LFARWTLNRRSRLAITCRIADFRAGTAKSVVTGAIIGAVYTRTPVTGIIGTPYSIITLGIYLAFTPGFTGISLLIACFTWRTGVTGRLTIIHRIAGFYSGAEQAIITVAVIGGVYTRTPVTGIIGTHYSIITLGVYLAFTPGFTGISLLIACFS
jgi:hypothetical protein